MTKYTPGSGSTGRINRPYSPRGSTPWQRVKHHGWTEVIRVPELGACWESNAPIGGRGYRVVGNGTGRNEYAHRISFRHAVGPIPVGQVVRHRCDNPPCINPAHLELGTQGDNNRDQVQRNRQSRAPHATLTEPQVREIKASLAEGAQMKPLAARYGVSRTAIRKIARGETWKWL